MKLDVGALLFQLGVSLFCGIIIVAIGFGAALPVINRIAGPFVCPGNTLNLETHNYYPRPGETDTTINWNCVDNGTGVSRDVSFPTVLVSGLLYSALIYVVLVVRSMLKGNQPDPAPTPRRYVTPPAHRSDSEGTLKRLEELKKLRESDLITEQEFEKKKAEILEGL